MDPRDRDDVPDLSLRSRSTAPKTIGVLNIVFGSLMLLCVVCSSLNLMMQANMGPMMAAQQQQMQAAIQAERQQELAELRQQEKAAVDEKERARIVARRKALAAQPVPKMPDFTKFTKEETLQTYLIADVTTAFVVNVLMIVAGVGLVGYREWGRSLALWVAAIKIVRLLVLYTYYILVVVPVMAQTFVSIFREVFDEVAKNGPPGKGVPGPKELEQMGTMMGVMGTGFAIMMMLFGIIYPIITLIVLTRPHVKAACTPARTDVLPNDDFRDDLRG